MKLQSYAQGKWVNGEGAGKELFNSITGEVVAEASSKGLDFGDMLTYAREVGSPALRKLTFHERGRMLKALAFHLLEKKADFY
ncbi:MAG: phenylacetic acid degradation bifunctional protein PaaZ, partial [Flavobacteriales bacterium]